MVVSILAVALLLQRGTSAQAQPQPLQDLRQAVTELAVAVAALPPPLRQPRLVSAADWLRTRSATAKAEDITAEYVTALTRTAQLLRAQPTEAVVDDVTSELEAKVEHCRRLGIGMGGTVGLKVSTSRGVTTVGGMDVLYLLKFDEWLKMPPRSFPGRTSPAAASVPPGNYWFWARDPATGRIGERKLVPIAGQKEFTIDLAAP